MMDNIFFHAFNLIPQIGPVRINKLLKYFGSLEKAWSADAFDLARSGLEEFVIYKILAARKTINPEQEYTKLSPDIKIITINDFHYPKILKEISHAPFILYLRGNPAALKTNAIAIVGTRKITPYGQRSCEEITTDLTQAGLTIISGLAEGVDTIAHQTCLTTNGTTIAVIGSGINNNCIFPKQNIKLAENIIANNGALISEYPPDTKAQRQFFPARNRIISGLSLGTCVIEAGEKSGALITAYKALEQNKEVFAVPGSIYSSRSIGCNKIIKKGAKLVQNYLDILEELPADSYVNYVGTDRDLSVPFNLSGQEKQIISQVSDIPAHIDKILKCVMLPRSQVLTGLTMLEIKGFIKKINNNQYIIWQKI